MLVSWGQITVRKYGNENRNMAAIYIKRWEEKTEQNEVVSNGDLVVKAYFCPRCASLNPSIYYTIDPEVRSLSRS